MPYAVEPAALMVSEPPTVGVAVGLAVLLLAYMPPVVPIYNPPPVPFEVIDILPVEDEFAFVDWMNELSYIVRPQVPWVALIATSEAEMIFPPVPSKRNA